MQKCGPKIAELRVRTVKVPMSHPHQTASGTITESPLVLIDVLTDEGTVGHSIVFTFTSSALKPTAELVRSFEPLLQDQVLAPTELTDRLSRRYRLLGCQGLVAMAIGGTDMALWDAMARGQNLSLARLLGSVERSIPAYGAVGYDGELQSARDAECWAKRGFRAIKAKIGYPTVKQDVEVVRAIRKAVGDDFAIMVDYNQSLTPAAAIQRLRSLEDEGLTWVEEPVLAHDLAGHAQVAREIRTPIQCGENWWSALEVRTAAELRSSDYVMLDVMKIGGVTGWLRAGAVAAAHSIPVSTHLWPELSAQLMCATPNAHYLEYADWWNAVLTEPLSIEQGMAVVNDTLGTGVSWNEKNVAELLV
jgi:mandelate racemase